jgi:hypothetical protein
MFAESGDETEDGLAERESALNLFVPKEFAQFSHRTPES